MHTFVSLTVLQEDVGLGLNHTLVLRVAASSLNAILTSVVPGTFIRELVHGIEVLVVASTAGITRRALHEMTNALPLTQSSLGQRHE